MTRPITHTAASAALAQYTTDHRCFCIGGILCQASTALDGTSCTPHRLCSKCGGAMHDVCMSASCCKRDAMMDICMEPCSHSAIQQYSRAQISNQCLNGGTGSTGLLVSIDCIILQLLQNLQAVVDVVYISQLRG